MREYYRNSSLNGTTLINLVAVHLCCGLLHFTCALHVQSGPAMSVVNKKRWLPFRQHLLDALLLGVERNVSALATEEFVLRTIGAHHWRRLQLIRHVLQDQPEEAKIPNDF